LTVRWWRTALTIGDGVVLAAGALLTGALAISQWGGMGTEARYAQIRGSQGVVTVALDHARSVDVPGALGPSTLEIAPGAIRVRTAPCAGRQCVHAGWLRRPGDAAVCVPGRLSVRVLGADAFDAVSY
jgi:hypothetical protein